MTEEDDSTEPALMRAFRRLIDERDHWKEVLRLGGQRGESARREIARIDNAVRLRTAETARGRTVTLGEWILLAEEPDRRSALIDGNSTRALEGERRAELEDLARDWVSSQAGGVPEWCREVPWTPEELAFELVIGVHGTLFEPAELPDTQSSAELVRACWEEVKRERYAQNRRTKGDSELNQAERLSKLVEKLEAALTHK